VPSQVRQDVLTRRDRASQACCRRVPAGQKAGHPRSRGRGRYHPCTSKQEGQGATVDNGRLGLATSGRLGGRLGGRWSRPLAGPPKTVSRTRPADGGYATIVCAEGPGLPRPLTGQETGIDRGLERFATRADGSQIANPRVFRVAERALQRAQRRGSRPKPGRPRRRQALARLARAQQPVRPRAGVRPPLSRGLAGGQSGADPHPGQAPQRCRLGAVLPPPRFQSRRRWAARRCRAACLPLASRFGRRRARPHGALGALARLPRGRDAPPPGPQRRPQHRAPGKKSGRAGPAGANVAHCGQRSLSISRIHPGECQKLSLFLAEGAEAPQPGRRHHQRQPLGLGVEGARGLALRVRADGPPHASRAPRS
jgi:hypothetical protein